MMTSSIGSGDGKSVFWPSGVRSGLQTAARASATNGEGAPTRLQRPESQKSLGQTMRNLRSRGDQPPPRRKHHHRPNPVAPTSPHLKQLPTAHACSPPSCCPPPLSLTRQPCTSGLRPRLHTRTLSVGYPTSRVTTPFSAAGPHARIRQQRHHLAARRRRDG